MRIAIQLPETIMIGGKEIDTKALVLYQCKGKTKLAMMKEERDGWVCLSILWYNPQSQKGLCLHDVFLEKASLEQTVDDQGFTIYARKKPQRVRESRQRLNRAAIAHCV